MRDTFKVQSHSLGDGLPVLDNVIFIYRDRDIQVGLTGVRYG